MLNMLVITRHKPELNKIIEGYTFHNKGFVIMHIENNKVTKNMHVPSNKKHKMTNLIHEYTNVYVDETIKLDIKSQDSTQILNRLYQTNDIKHAYDLMNPKTYRNSSNSIENEIQTLDNNESIFIYRGTYKGYEITISKSTDPYISTLIKDTKDSMLHAFKYIESELNIDKIHEIFVSDLEKKT